MSTAKELARATENVKLLLQSGRGVSDGKAPPGVDADGEELARVSQLVVALLQSGGGIVQGITGGGALQNATTAPPATPVAAPTAPTGSWNTATATHYTSWPDCCTDPNADQTECKGYNGCTWKGYFKAFNEQKPKSWVEKNNIVAFYESPEGQNKRVWDTKYKNKRIRIRNPKTGKTMDATIIDTCSDNDCPDTKCCSTNANLNGGYLVDLEINTARRFYDGKLEGLAPIQWQLLP